MEKPDSQEADSQIIAAAGDEPPAGSLPLPCVSDRWAAAGYAVAGLLGAVASLFTVMSRQDPNAGSFTSSTGDITVSTTASFDAWGWMVVSSIPPVLPAGGMGVSSSEIPGGPSYGIVLCAAAVVLLTAAISTAFPGRFGLPRLLRGLGPVGAGILAGVAACQLLTFSSFSRPIAPPGASGPIETASPTWQLGPCSWITVAAALAAAATWLFAQYHSNTGRSLLTDVQSLSSGPGFPAPADPTDLAPLDAPRTLPPTPGGIDQDPPIELNGDPDAAFRRPAQRHQG